MKSHLLLKTIAAVVLVGCGEAPLLERIDRLNTAKALDISIHDTAARPNIEAVEQQLAAGTDVNAKDDDGGTSLHYAAVEGHKEIVEPLIDNGANVNAKGVGGNTPLDWAIVRKHPETIAPLRKHGAKTGEELKAEQK